MVQGQEGGTTGEAVSNQEADSSKIMVATIRCQEERLVEATPKCLERPIEEARYRERLVEVAKLTEVEGPMVVTR